MIGVVWILMIAGRPEPSAAFVTQAPCETLAAILAERHKVAHCSKAPLLEVRRGRR